MDLKDRRHSEWYKWPVRDLEGERSTNGPVTATERELAGMRERG